MTGMMKFTLQYDRDDEVYIVTLQCHRDDVYTLVF